MTYILAEIASSHVGDVNKCKELVKAAHEAGADGVKVQIWQESEIIHHPRYDNLKRFELTHTDWIDVRQLAWELPIDLWIEPTGNDSVEFAMKLKPDYWKIPYRLSENIGLMPGKGIFWRNLPIDKGRTAAIGEQGYPTPLKDALDELGSEHIKADSKVLYADHSNIELSGYPVARMAKALGVWGIEKHICLNREELKKDSMDYISALEPDEFKDFVEAMR